MMSAQVTDTAEIVKPMASRQSELQEASGGSHKQWRFTVIPVTSKFKDLFSRIMSICSDLDGSLIVVSNFDMHGLLKVDQITGSTSVISGGFTSGQLDGNIKDAQFYYPHTAVVTSDGTIYVSDTLNRRIRKIDRARESVIIVVGDLLRGAGLKDGIGGKYSPF